MQPTILSSLRIPTTATTHHPTSELELIAEPFSPFSICRPLCPSSLCRCGSRRFAAPRGGSLTLRCSSPWVVAASRILAVGPRRFSPPRRFSFSPPRWRRFCFYAPHRVSPSLLIRRGFSSSRGVSQSKRLTFVVSERKKPESITSDSASRHHGHPALFRITGSISGCGMSRSREITNRTCAPVVWWKITYHELFPSWDQTNISRRGPFILMEREREEMPGRALGRERVTRENENLGHQRPGGRGFLELKRKIIM
ncbi:hypothetical protein Ahy_A06g030832 isoform H [Arachis hypogaea]|uniref:Uncharacterized protein n=1 Tax=Arachis hypogaea TaxID=3818 RepID=A0A445CXJ8_ARAHY|nr:hypothetical protein Ahy_A06g030832 isoform H [Arachis hypogaea]